MQDTITCEVCGKEFTYERHRRRRTVCDNPECKKRRQKNYYTSRRSLDDVRKYLSQINHLAACEPTEPVEEVLHKIQVASHSAIQLLNRVEAK
jgi:hypothetical protein